MTSLKFLVQEVKWKYWLSTANKIYFFKSHLIPSSTCFASPLPSVTGKQTADNCFLFSCVMTISQDIFNICITCVVYEVRRKGIIYSKTYFFSLFTPCLGIKSQSNKSRNNLGFMCPLVFKNARLLFLLCVIFCLLFWTGFGVMSGNTKAFSFNYIF